MSKGKWKGGDSFDVTGEGNADARAKEKAEEPLVNKPTNFSAGRRDEIGRYTTSIAGQGPQSGDEPVTYPAIYGVDMRERKRQAILRDITLGQQGSGNGGGALPTRELIGDRQVMLDDQTVKWLMDEQDRMGLIAKDEYFEKSAIASGLFSTPHGLDYLHKIKPDYFKRRRKLAKWVANAQLKLFDIRMNGIQNEADFNFLYMLQSLTEEQKKVLTKPVWLLNQLESVDNKPSWQSGIFARPSKPFHNQVSSFAGMGSVNGTGIGTGTQGSSSPFSWMNLWGSVAPTPSGWPRS